MSNSEQQGPFFDISSMVHDLGPTYHSEGITQLRDQVARRLRESEDMRTPEGAPMAVAAVLEMADMTQEVADEVTRLSAQGLHRETPLTPLQAFVCATQHVTPEDARGNTLNYRNALRAYTVHTNPEIAQAIAILTNLYEMHGGRLLLVVEGNTDEIIASNRGEVEEEDPFVAGRREKRTVSNLFGWQEKMSYQNLATGNFDEAFGLYRSSLDLARENVFDRDTLLVRRLTTLVGENPNIYAVVVRRGMAHEPIGDMLAAEGYSVSVERDRDLVGGREFPFSFHDRFTMRPREDTLTDLELWQGLIGDVYYHLLASDNYRGSDVVGRHIAISQEVYRTTLEVLQTMDDIDAWRVHMTAAMLYGKDFVTAHEEFLQQRGISINR